MPCMVQPENPPLLSPIPTPFMLFPSSIYYVSRRRDDRRVPQTPIVPIDVEFWQNNPAFVPIVLLFDRAEATFSCRLSRVSGPFTFLRLRRWHGSITYLPFTKRKKEWTKTASASEREEEQASSQSLCFVNRDYSEVLTVNPRHATKAVSSSVPY